MRCQTAAEIRADLKRLKRDTDSGRSAAARRGVAPLDVLHPLSYLGAARGSCGKTPIPISPLSEKRRPNTQS